MRTLTGKVESVEYFDTSRNGNSRYTAHIGGIEVFTGVDSCLGSAISNYEGKRVSVQARIIRGKLTIDSRIEVLPDHTNAPYYRAQFEALQLDQCKEFVRVKFMSEFGQTNHLSISPDKARRILEILTESEG